MIGDGDWGVVLVIELLSRIPSLFAPAANALGTPPAMRFPDHHLNRVSLDLRLRRGPSVYRRRQSDSRLDKRAEYFVDFNDYNYLDIINVNMVESQNNKNMVSTSSDCLFRPRFWSWITETAASQQAERTSKQRQSRLTLSPGWGQGKIEGQAG